MFLRTATVKDTRSNQTIQTVKSALVKLIGNKISLSKVGKEIKFEKNENRKGINKKM